MTNFFLAQTMVLIASLLLLKLPNRKNSTTKLDDINLDFSIKLIPPKVHRTKKGGVLGLTHQGREDAGHSPAPASCADVRL